MSYVNFKDIEVSGKTVKIADFNLQKIIEDGVIQEIGNELLKELPDCIDCSGVDFISSAAYGKFITLDKKLKAQGRYLAIVNTHPEIYDVLSITRLNRMFEIKDTLEDYLASV